MNKNNVPVGHKVSKRFFPYAMETPVWEKSPDWTLNSNYLHTIRKLRHLVTVDWVRITTQGRGPHVLSSSERDRTRRGEQKRRCERKRAIETQYRYAPFRSEVLMANSSYRCFYLVPSGRQPLVLIQNDVPYIQRACKVSRSHDSVTGTYFDHFFDLLVSKLIML